MMDGRDKGTSLSPGLKVLVLSFSSKARCSLREVWMSSEKAEDAQFPLCWEASSLFWIVEHFLHLLLLLLLPITPTLRLQWLSVDHHHGDEFCVQNNLAPQRRDFSQCFFALFFPQKFIFQVATAADT